MPKKAAHPNPDPAALPLGTVTQAAAAIGRGGIVAYPTEAVYGLGCDPHNETALARLLELKGRAAHKGFILVAADLAQLQPWLAPLDETALARCQATWPGPVTWVVPARAGVSALLSGGRDTLAVRVTAHPPAAALCRACGHALVSTSANLSAASPARDLAALAAQFGGALTLVLRGELGGAAQPTSIRDLRSGEVLRP